MSGLLDNGWDLDADILDAACVRVVLVRCGATTDAEYGRLCALVRACAVVAPAAAEPRAPPLGEDVAEPATAEAMRLRFLGEWALDAECAAARDEWQLLQPHVVVRAVIGVCAPASVAERAAACAEARNKAARGAPGAIVRCFAFDAPDDLFADAAADACASEALSLIHI